MVGARRFDLQDVVSRLIVQVPSEAFVLTLEPYVNSALCSCSALWVAAALLVAATLVAGQAWGPLARAGLVALALLSTAAGFGLNELIQRFIYTGYNHAK